MLHDGPYRQHGVAAGSCNRDVTKVVPTIKNERNALHFVLLVIALQRDYNSCTQISAI